jgi:hypothetical protein
MSVEIEPTGAQASWDGTFAKLDRSCPVRRADESGTDYLRRLAIIGKRYIPKSEDIHGVTFRKDTADPLLDNAVPKYAEMVREAVERNLYRTDNMEPGELRAVMRVDEWHENSRILRAGQFRQGDVRAASQGCRRVVSARRGLVAAGRQRPGLAERNSATRPPARHVRRRGLVNGFRPVRSQGRKEGTRAKACPRSREGGRDVGHGLDASPHWAAGARPPVFLTGAFRL